MRRRLEGIYREHRQGLYSLALSITRSTELAEDAIHDAFLRLWRTGRQPGGDVVAYVFASVRNAAIEVRRRRRRDTERTTSIFAPVESAPTPSPAALEQQHAARKAVDALPMRARQVVVMRLYAGLTFQQIADTLQEPLQTVASRYRRALERIRDELTPYEP